MAKKSFNILRTVFAGIAVAVCAMHAGALSPSYYAPASKLSEGKWVKIRTTGEGIHEITYDQLRQWGFSSPENVNVYGYGATLLADDIFSESVPDDVTLTYTHHEENKIFFYSTGDITTKLNSPTQLSAQRNYYSTDVFYLLSDRRVSSDEAIASAEVRDGQSKILDAHLSVQYFDDEVQNPTQRGGYFLGYDIMPGKDVDLPVDVTDMGSGNTSWKNAAFMAGFAALNTYSTSMPIALPDAISSSNVRVINNAATYSYEQYAHYKVGSVVLNIDQMIPNGRHTFRAQYPANNPSFIATDYYWMIYPRLSRMGGLPQLSMYFYNVSDNNTGFTVEGGTATRIVNVSSPAHVFPHELDYDSERHLLRGSFVSNDGISTHLVAFDVDKAQLPVDFVCDVENQNYHAFVAPDMVILATSTVMDAAEQLAAIHRDYDGMEVCVIQHDLLFNEFSSATPDIMAYRRFLKMLEDRNPGKLRYVILYGPSHWDNRAINVDKKDRLLIYETTNPAYSSLDTKAFGNDGYLAMLDDNFTPAKIGSSKQYFAVGRIPAPDALRGFAYNGKVRDYLENLPPVSVYNTALVMSDDGDANSHLLQAEEIATRLTARHPAMTAVKVHNAVYRWHSGDAKDLRSIVTSTLNRGTGMWTYIGHGNEDGFGGEKLWTRNFANTVDYRYAPFCMLSTCTAFGFDLEKDNVAEAMIFNRDGGAICLIAAGRIVYGALNHLLCLNITDQYTAARPGDTFGSVWLNARNAHIGSKNYSDDYQINSLNYNFGGDPALPVSAPSLNVEITNIDGIPPQNIQDSLVLEPLKPVEIEGRIVDADNRIDKQFNGAVTLHLYDSPYMVQTLMRTTDSLLNIKMNHDLLMTKTVNVVDGVFKASVIIPVPVNESGVNRLTMHADAADGRRADGAFGRLRVIAPESTDASANVTTPTITGLVVSDGSPKQSSILTGTLRLTAKGTTGSAGLNSSLSIGAGSSLLIDNVIRVDGAREGINTLEEDWWLDIELPEMTQGNHTATLIIADNVGNRTSRTTSFTYAPIHDVALRVSQTTVHDMVTFDVEHDLGNITACRLVVEDTDGNQLINRTDISFPYTVSLAEANAVNGFYKAFIQLTGENGHGASAPVEIVFYNNN